MKISRVIFLCVGACLAADSLHLVQHISKRFALADPAGLAKRIDSTEINRAIDMKFYGKAIDDDFTSLAEPEDLDGVWIGVAFDGLVLHADFEMDFHPTELTHEIVQKIGGVSFEFGIPGLIKAEVNFTLLFHGWMNDTKSANFTYGFDVHVPDSYAFIFPVQDLLKTDGIGFENSIIIPGNLTPTTPDLAFAFQSAFRPQISYHAEAEFLDEQYDASIFADIPALNMRVSQVHNVNAKCEPAPVGAPDTDVFADLTYITPSVGFDLEVDDNHSLSVLANSTVPLPTSCLEFFAKQTRLAVPLKSGEKKNGGSVLGASSISRLFSVGLLMVLTFYE
ncbi:hypothetical protein HYALB_00013519 [Hymenoscyphus albidus]|uniref:Uncharacterized protein n=1 Tax=Hymenoscyphus albidus TaxID=595503 RepID=A0A9N9Q4Z0_9HELO|nr:hypothetical protein HYALB_00013519 [Hymenoscyphus albidus]